MSGGTGFEDFLDNLYGKSVRVVQVAFDFEVGHFLVVSESTTVTMTVFPSTV